MSQPDPDFVKFFGGEFQRELAAVEIPGMADASWDRKAAWLLWLARRPARRLEPISQDPATMLQVASIIADRDKPRSVFD
jgi:hypothetical protein